MVPNKTYQADLENKKLVFKEIGLFIALLVVYLLFNAKFQTRENAVLEIEEISAIVEEIIPVTIQESKPLPPEPVQQTSVLKIVENDVKIETDVTIDAAADQETVIEEYIPPFFAEIEEEAPIEEAPIFVVVESMPSYPGGLGELMKYFHQNLCYPRVARETGIQGKVFVSFVVETDGAISDVQILRGIGGGCDEEALRVVRNMPKWIPGKQRNIPVRVRYNLPVKFTLQ
jgi:protein TonB